MVQGCVLVKNCFVRAFCVFKQRWVLSWYVKFPFSSISLIWPSKVVNSREHQLCIHVTLISSKPLHGICFQYFFNPKPQSTFWWRFFVVLCRERRSFLCNFWQFNCKQFFFIPVRRTTFAFHKEPKVRVFSLC